MSNDLIEIFLKNISWFDLVIVIILIYNVLQCSLKGFSLSFLSFLKWIVALILTIIFVPKIQPWVSTYVDSPFINDLGLGIILYISFLFSLILLGKAINSSMKWTGFGPMDKTFGFFFGFFKGYIVSVCLFSIINWFYPFNNWSIKIDKALTYNFIKNSSEILVEEFPEYRDLKDSKEKIENI